MVLLSDFHQILADGYDQYARWGKKAPLVLAGGGIVWRLDATGEPEVCLVHRPRYDDWSWPKGKLEAHESIFHCAAREIQEEIGQPVALGMFLGHTSYPLPDEGKSAGKGTKKVKAELAKIPIRSSMYFTGLPACLITARLHIGLPSLARFIKQILRKSAKYDGSVLTRPKSFLLALMTDASSALFLPLLNLD